MFAFFNDMCYSSDINRKRGVFLWNRFHQLKRKFMNF